MQIEYLDPRTLNPAPYNPRKMTEKEANDLRASLDRFGFVDPIIINMFPGRERIVIGGHQRLRIALERGMPSVPTVKVSLEEERERELNLRLNKNLGGWDWDLLANFDIEMLRDVGFTDADLGLDVSESDFPPPEGDKYGVTQVMVYFSEDDHAAFLQAMEQLRSDPGFNWKNGNTEEGNAYGRGLGRICRDFCEGH